MLLNNCGMDILLNLLRIKFRFKFKNLPIKSITQDTLNFRENIKL